VIKGDCKVGNVVSLTRVDKSTHEEIRGSISTALDLIGLKIDGSVKSVVIKPNLCYYWDAATGYTTDQRVVSAVIDCVRERWGENVEIKVAEADASAMRTKYVFPVLGYTKLAEEKNVTLVNLSKDVLIDRTVRVGSREISFMVPELLLRSDMFINVPKLKIMRATKITCAMKNIFGAIGYPRKIEYHSILNEAIVGINKILHPHLTIVDGLIALGRFPIKLGLIMAGTDPFSVDCIASQIMGYRPLSVRSLKIALDEHLGSLEGITTKGVDISDFREIFPKAKFTDSDYWWNLQFWLVKAYRRVSGDVVPPFLDEE
jgi:uncharacterized protein (DUF362 family)